MEESLIVDPGVSHSPMPEGLLETLASGGGTTWMQCFLGAVLFVGFVLVLILSKTQRGPLLLLAFSWLPIPLGMIGSGSGMLSMMSAWAQHPATTESDMLAGLYVALVPLLFGVFIGGFHIVMSLFALGLKTDRFAGKETA